MSRRNQVLISVLGLPVLLFLVILYSPQNTSALQSLFGADQYNVDDGYGKVIGIDLGVDYSRVGYQRKGKFEIITDNQGHVVTPSCVAFKDNVVLVGQDAKNELTHDSQNTICGVGRLIGNTFSGKNFQETIAHLPYTVVHQSGKSAIKLRVGGTEKAFTPEEILSKLIEKLKKDAENYLDIPITHAVVTVPTHFGDSQRQAVKDAGILAGLNILRLVNEPTVAAIAHELERISGWEERYVLVYNMQETTLDVTLSVLEAGVFEILSNVSNSQLGGKDLDHTLLNYMVGQYNLKANRDISEDAGAMGRMKFEIEKAEKELSVNNSALIQIQPRRDGFNFSETITTTTVHQLNEKIFKQTVTLVESAIEQSKIGKSQVDEIIITGSSTHVAKIRPLLEVYFDGKKARGGISPDEAIVRGAAAQGAVLSEPSSDCCVSWVEVNHLSVGVEIAGGIFEKMIPRNTVIPTRKIRMFSTSTDNQSKIVLNISKGERMMAEDNQLLGTLVLTDIPLAPAGIPFIEVVFELDPHGGLTVIAIEKDSGMEARLVLPDRAETINYDDIDMVVRGAETHYHQDLARREVAMGLKSGNHENPFAVKIRPGQYRGSGEQSCTIAYGL